MSGEVGTLHRVLTSDTSKSLSRRRRVTIVKCEVYVEVNPTKLPFRNRSGEVLIGLEVEDLFRKSLRLEFKGNRKLFDPASLPRVSWLSVHDVENVPSSCYRDLCKQCEWRLVRVLFT